MTCCDDARIEYDEGEQVRVCVSCGTVLASENMSAAEANWIQPISGNNNPIYESSTRTGNSTTNIRHSKSPINRAFRLLATSTSDHLGLPFGPVSSLYRDYFTVTKRRVPALSSSRTMRTVLAAAFVHCARARSAPLPTNAVAQALAVPSTSILKTLKHMRGVLHLTHIAPVSSSALVHRAAQALTFTTKTEKDAVIKQACFIVSLFRQNCTSLDRISREPPIAAAAVLTAYAAFNHIVPPAALKQSICTVLACTASAVSTRLKDLANTIFHAMRHVPWFDRALLGKLHPAKSNKSLIIDAKENIIVSKAFFLHVGDALTDLQRVMGNESVEQDCDELEGEESHDEFDFDSEEEADDIEEDCEE
ncbi:hypothetical protein HDU77_002590 [Chytriomyces hyalinus]|nr:hypothetical protein HDU77_002590 [Chytriomyces hyalinus]